MFSIAGWYGRHPASEPSVPAFRPIIAAVALAGLAGAAPAAAQSPCAGIADRSARLECYDRAGQAPARPAAPPQAARTQAPGGFACEGKRTCREMANCAEARFYLLRCGAGQLDRDNDGVPCESLCR
jgi:hypothetical protein